MPQRLHLEKFGPVHALPVLHYKMEFASLVRQAVDHLQPDCIAIELPPTLQDHFLRGVRHLPEISVLRYELGRSGRPSAGGGETVFLFIEPADPLVEAARLAGERDIPLHCIDVDVEGYPCHEEPFPDSYAVRRIGLGAYYNEYCKVFGNSLPGREDLLREKGMAFRLQQLSAAFQADSPGLRHGPLGAAEGVF